MPVHIQKEGPVTVITLSRPAIWITHQTKPLTKNSMSSRCFESMGRVKVAQGAPGHLDHFQGAQHAEGVVGMQPPGRFGVALRQQGVHGLGACCIQLLPEFLPNAGIRRTVFEQSVDQRLDVEPRTPHYERRNAPPDQVGDHLPGLVSVHGRIIVPVRINDVHHVMAHRGPLPGRGLGRAHIHSPVNLHGIGAHDLTSEPPGQLDGERRLAHTRGPADHDNFWQVRIIHYK